MQMFRKLAALLLIVVLALLTFPCVGHAADTAERYGLNEALEDAGVTDADYAI